MTAPACWSCPGAGVDLQLVDTCPACLERRAAAINREHVEQELELAAADGEYAAERQANNEAMAGRDRFQAIYEYEKAMERKRSGASREDMAEAHAHAVGAFQRPWERR